MFRKTITLLIALIALSLQQLVAQEIPDSISTEVPPREDASRSYGVAIPDTVIQLDASKVATPKLFQPDPMLAVWYSALMPGLGQIYNRQMWKLPIIMGSFVAITYGTMWNNRNYIDYSKAYKDLVDNDPASNSYLDFYWQGATDADVDKTWLTGVLERGKDSYRYNRDLCIIIMVGVYGLNIIDAYVDAQLYSFNVTPDLSMKVTPTVMGGFDTHQPFSAGLRCALTF